MTTLRKLTENERFRVFDLGHSDALVSDYTVIDDFDADLAALSLLDAKPGDFIWQLAERIEKEREE